MLLENKMSLNLDAAAFALMGIKQIPVAVTTVYDGRTNGLITLSGAPAGIIPEAPLALVSITKFNFSHDLILKSGIFTIHALGASDELIEPSLEIMRILGGCSGRDIDKIAKLKTKLGATGAPILLDTLAYVEVKVTGSLDNEENTIFVGKVVAAGKLHSGKRLDINEAWVKLGKEWTDAYEAHHEPQLNHCREVRGLPIPA
jgi:flavin reductase (DIM6/NTAB) family NADH-FMN oxidoreductase RutF